MSKRLHQTHGFSMVEVLVALLLTTIGALAMATTFVGAAALNRQIASRQKAQAYARQQIDRIKSLDYADVALTQDNMGDTDWSNTYCPLRGEADVPQCASSVIKSSLTASQLNKDDPREVKIAAQGLASGKRFKLDGAPTVRRRGIILYTYIYGNNWNNTAAAQQYKIITVVARYSDSKPGVAASDSKMYTSVKVTSIIADIPQIGQVK